MDGEQHRVLDRLHRQARQGLEVVRDHVGGSASFAKQVAKYRKLTAQQPQNTGYWEQLIKVLLNEAGGEAYVSNGGPTPKGRELFSQTAASWERTPSLWRIARICVRTVVSATTAVKLKLGDLISWRSA